MKLAPGTLCYAQGSTYQIDGQQSSSHVIARDCASGRMVSLAIKDLQRPPTPSGTALEGPIDPMAWQRATRLATDLEPWRGHQRIPTPVLSRLAQRHRLSSRQLQRLRARYEKDPRTTALMPERTGRPRGARVLDERVEAVIEHAIKRHYLQREQPSVAHLVDRLGTLCRRLDLVPPSRPTVVSRVNEEESYEMDRARRGAKAAKQIWEARTGGLTTERPLQIVQIDHTRVDVLLVSDDRKRVLPRPWITLAIDVFTRCVVGWYLTMDAPGSVSVALCIEHMALPKPENSLAPGIWPMYGKPDIILVDNGKDFRAEALKTGCEQHGIELRWRPVKRPHYGAHIERLNGTLMRMIHRLRGTTFSNTRQRGDYASETRATMTLGELRAWLVQAICREYHVKAHRALGISPQLAWEQAWNMDNGTRRPVPQVHRPVDFRLDFLPRDFRRIRRTGVEFACSRYWHDDLTLFLRQKDDAEIRYDPRDLSRIWVRAGRLGFIEAVAKAGRAVGDFTADRRMTTAEQVRMHAAYDQGLAVRDAIEASALKETRAARQGKKVAARVDRTPAPKVIAAPPTAGSGVATAPPPPLLALPPPETVATPPTASTPLTANEITPTAPFQPATPAPVRRRAPTPIAFEIWS